MIIRPVIEADLPYILVIENQSLSSWSMGSLRSEIASPHSLMSVLEIKGIVVAWGACRLVAGEAELMKISVDSLYRKQGVGFSLLSHIVCQVAELGGEKIFLEVRSQNSPAISLYKKHGFAEVGIRKNYYHNPGDNALIFDKKTSYTSKS
ncbi:MAG: ribosomal protein S18-alanine N-acetyltransferase [Desulfotalea sp.]